MNFHKKILEINIKYFVKKSMRKLLIIALILFITPGCVYQKHHYKNYELNEVRTCPWCGNIFYVGHLLKKGETETSCPYCNRRVKIYEVEPK